MFLLISCPFRVHNFCGLRGLFNLLFCEIWDRLYVCTIVHSIPSTDQISLCRFYLVDFNVSI
jgi:hypothetical protein